MGAAHGGAAGAIIGAAIEPALAVMLDRAIQELGALRKASAAEMLEEAARRLDRGPDDMVSDALVRPRQAQLLGEAINAAARTVNRQKLRALARALANGLGDDDAPLDEERPG
jgi:hypothetical protein